jgi:hypothetical protein
MAAGTTTAAATLLLAFTSLHSAPQSANAALGAAGGAVTSPAIVASIKLADWLKLPEKKQRQYEGGFLSCKSIVLGGNAIDYATDTNADPFTFGAKK